MTRIVWDAVGERLFETGLDRGVLYPNSGPGVAWNGLTSVEDSSSGEKTSYFLDGVKYLEKVIPSDYSGNLKALTYPHEFEPMVGVSELHGLAYHDQPPVPFGLSYRTLRGNDINSTNFGYRVHILYNLLATPDSIVSDTTNETSNPTEFSWSLTGKPVRIAGIRPTVHISIDSVNTHGDSLLLLENILYGTTTTSPRLPTLTEITDLFYQSGVLIIVDNGDGTWTANDTSNAFITMLDSTTFSITGANTTTVDANTYTISTTEL